MEKHGREEMTVIPKKSMTCFHIYLMTITLLLAGSLLIVTLYFTVLKENGQVEEIGEVPFQSSERYEQNVESTTEMPTTSAGGKVVVVVTKFGGGGLPARHQPSDQNTSNSTNITET